MTTGPNVELPLGGHTKSLAKALGQNKHVNELVQQSAEELATVNTVLQQEFEETAAPSAVEAALEQNATIEEKVQDASAQLMGVNLALEREVRVLVKVEHQLAAVVEQQGAASYVALHDALTGLPNRALFNDRLEHGLAQARRHGWTLAVMFVDLDKFKNVNDTYGHEAGDIVLQTVARRLTENTRGDDTVSRYGGDEFLYMLTEAPDFANIAMIARKIIRAIQAPCIVKVRDLEIAPSIGASIGIAIFPKDGATADAVLKTADAAMYRARQSNSGYAFDRRGGVRAMFESGHMYVHRRTDT